MVVMRSLSENPIPVPASLASRCRNWSVVLQVDVDAHGVVKAVRIERSSGEALIDRAASSTARYWTYVPANIAGQDRAGTVRIPRLVEPDAATCAASGFQPRREPTILQFATAPWPPTLASTSQGRAVTFLVALDDRGTVLWERMTASSGDADADRAARAHLPSRYAPATLDGKPVRSFVRVGVPVGGAPRIIADPELDKTILGG